MTIQKNKSKELKFRVWNPTYQEMLYPSTPTKNGDYEEKIYLQLDGQLIGDFKHTGIINCSEHYVIQQFTGMLDKNSKEIYEGDIIQRSFGKIPYKVPLVCEWSNEEASYILKDTNGNNYVYLSDFIESVEIVGNIFENEI
jgi:uncharacterized phage protein (TIGR01671 family)